VIFCIAGLRQVGSKNNRPNAALAVAIKNGRRISTDIKPTPMSSNRVILAMAVIALPRVQSLLDTTACGCKYEHRTMGVSDQAACEGLTQFTVLNLVRAVGKTD